MDDIITKRKIKLRRSFLNVRKSLSSLETDFLSEKIINHLKSQSFFMEASTIHMYVSIDQNCEVSTKELIRHSLAIGKKVIIPKMEPEGALTHHQLNSLTELKPNRWGVPEPICNRPIDPNDISVVVVPMIAADFKKNRLGYGKGYYDRFLVDIQAYRVGLCFNCTLSWCSLPTDRFDQAMNKIITESAIL